MTDYRLLPDLAAGYQLAQDLAEAQDWEKSAVIADASREFDSLQDVYALLDMVRKGG